MNLVESRSPNGGTLILRHRAYDLDDYSLDQRHCMLAVEVEGRCTVDEGLGHYKYDPVTVGDFPNPHRWQRSAEDSIPSGWSWAWPVLTIEQSGGAGGGGAPTVTAGIVISDPSGSGSRRVGGSATSTSAQPRRKDAEVLPIKDAPYSLDDRFEKLKPGQLSDDHHVWPKFPVNYVGIVLATSDEAQQVSTFHPTDPRLIAVNKAGDPYTGTLVCDTDGEFRVDKERTAKLHSMMRVLKKPLKGENAVAWNIVKSGMGDAFGGLVFDGKVGASVHVSQGGPFDCGLDADQHQLDKDGDGNPINSLHLSTGALFLVAGNVAYDGPLDFEQDKYPEADTGPKKMKVHLVWDSEATHQHPSGLKRGKWRWYAEATSSVVPAPCAPRTPTGGGPGRGPTGGGGGSPPVRTPDTGRVGTGVAGGSDGGPSIPPTVSTPGGGSPGGMSPAQPPTYDGYNLGAGHVPSEPSELPPYEPGAYSPSEPVDTGGFQPGLYPGEGDPADRIRGEVYRPGEGVFGPQYGPIEDLLNQPPTQGETTLGGPGRSMVENTMETSFPSINFRSPADVGAGQYDITHDPYPSEVDLSNFQNNAPVTMRAEGYARQQTAALGGGCGGTTPTGGPPAYTNPPCSGIYQGGTCDGGLAVMPGEITGGDTGCSYLSTDPDAPVMSNMMSVSKVFWALTPGVFLGFGEADRISGGIKNGYSCRVKTSAAQWYTHDSSGAKSEAIRFYSTQQIGWRNATNFYGKLAHVITADREWTFPDVGTRYVALNQWTLGKVTQYYVPYGGSDGSLTENIGFQANGAHVGIGQAPNAVLALVTRSASYALWDARISVLIEDSTAFGSTPGAGIVFSHKYNSAGDYVWGGSIHCGKLTGVDGNAASRLTFCVYTDGTAGLNEGMRLTGTGLWISSGAIGAPYQSARPLEVQDSSGAQMRLTHTQGTHHCDFTVDGAGNLTMTPSGGTTTFVGATWVHAAGWVIRPVADADPFVTWAKADGVTPVVTINTLTPGVAVTGTLQATRLGLGVAAGAARSITIAESFEMPGTTSATTGVIFKGADRFIHNFAPAGAVGGNTFVGLNAGNFTMYFTVAWETSYNTALGEGALYSLGKGYRHTAIGCAALYSMTYGWATVAVGFEAGYSAGVALTDLKYCTFVGTSATASVDNLSNSTALGSHATVTASNQIVFGDSSITQNLMTGEFRLQYSAAVYASHTIASTGVYTITCTGNNIIVSSADATTLPPLTVLNSSTGDAATRYALGTAISYAMGIDNSVAGDPFVLSTAASGTAVLGTGDLLSITSAGNATLTGTLQATRAGFGAAAHATIPLYALAETEQFRCAYSAAVYTSFTTKVNGVLTIATSNVVNIPANGLKIGNMAGTYVWYQNNQVQAYGSDLYLNYSGNDVICGGSAASVHLGVNCKPNGAFFESLGVTEQIRASYSAAVYASHTIASTGVYTISCTGNNLIVTSADATTLPPLTVTNSSTGDAAIRLNLGTTISYAMGIDNNVAGDPFVLSMAASGTAVLGTGDLLSITSAGNATLTGTLQATRAGFGAAAHASIPLLVSMAVGTYARFTSGANQVLDIALYDDAGPIGVKFLQGSSGNGSFILDATATTAATAALRLDAAATKQAGLYLDVGGANKVAMVASAAGNLSIDVAGTEVNILDALHLDGAFNHDGTTFGALGAAPATQLAHVADATGGVVVDAEVRVVANALLAMAERFGFHATA